jgi:hypothetical protein
MIQEYDWAIHFDIYVDKLRFLWIFLPLTKYFYYLSYLLLNGVHDR